MNTIELYKHVRELYELLPIGGAEVQYNEQTYINEVMETRGRYKVYNTRYSLIIMTIYGYIKCTVICLLSNL